MYTIKEIYDWFEYGKREGYAYILIYTLNEGNRSWAEFIKKGENPMKNISYKLHSHFFHGEITELFDLSLDIKTELDSRLSYKRINCLLRPWEVVPEELKDWEWRIS